MRKRLFMCMVLMLVLGQVWATSTYYVKLNAHEPTGNGLVYVSETAADVSEENYKTLMDALEVKADNDGEKKVLYAFAKPMSDDYLFTGWSWENGGEIVSRDNPFAVQLIARTDSKDYTKDVYANFFKKVECKHLINKSEGVVTVTDGTQTVTAPGYITTREELVLSAENVEGKDFLGWYYIDNGRRVFFSFEQKTQMIFDVKRVIGAEYVNKGMAAYYIKETGEMYTSFNTAVNAAKKCNGTMVLVHDGVLEAGDYTIPENVTLLIPFDDNQTCYKEKVESEYIKYGTMPYVFKTLMMENGARLIVNGALSVSAKMIAGSGGKDEEVCGGVYKGYGCIDMKEGSEIVVKNKANLYAWGYIVGDGKVTADSGSIVYEGFQITAFRGGTAINNMISMSEKVFPMNQYYVQNIEVPMTFNYGAAEKVVSSFWASETGKEVDAKVNVCEPLEFIGKGGLFELAEGTTLTKSYDGNRDRQVYSIDGDVILGDLSLMLLGKGATSAGFVLPLTNNLSITLESGTLTYKNPNGIAVLPGVELTIKEHATVRADKGSIYVYDSEDWGNYACYNQFIPNIYAPSRTCKRTTLEDARIDVQGTLITKESAFAYTTTKGGNILCSECSGSIIFVNGAGNEVETYQARQFQGNGGSALKIDSISITPAKLHNADGSYTETASATAGTTYYYVHGKWQTEEMSGLLGDVNRDGKVDVEDVKALSDILAGKDSADYNYHAADVDNNGRVTVRDMVKLIIMIGR